MRLLILTLLHPAFLVLVHAATTRSARGRLPIQLTTVAAILSAGLTACGLEFAIECGGGAPRAGDLSYVALASFLIGYGYFHVFNMTETSRRVRLLFLLMERGIDAADPSSCSEVEKKCPLRGPAPEMTLTVQGVTSGAAAEGRFLLNLSAEYNVEEILRLRLERLEHLGQVRREGDRYVLCGRTLYAGWALVNAFRKLLKFA